MDVTAKEKVREKKKAFLRGDMSGKITVVSVLLAASGRQPKSQTHFFILQKKKRKKEEGGGGKKKSKDKIKTWITVKCCLFWI